MQKFFLYITGVFLLLYAVAQLTLTNQDRPGVVTIVWESDPNPVREAQAEVFNKLHPGIHVKVATMSSEKILVKCATGVGPDLIGHINEFNMAQFVEAGILLDLTPYQKEYKFGPETTYPALAPMLMIEGRQYMYPANVAINALIYNRGLLTKLGIEFPRDDWTVEDFIAMGKKIRSKRNEKGQRYLFATTWGNRPFWDALRAGQNARFFTKDGLTSTVDSKRMIHATQDFKEMIYTHKILLNAAETQSMSSQGGWGAGGIDHFGTGKAAMAMIGRWFLVNYASYPKVHGQLSSVLWPRYKGKKPRVDISARGIGINAKGHHIKESLKFISYLASDAYSLQIVKDGDSLPPNKEIGSAGKHMVNKDVPDPAFHQTFVDATKYAVTTDLSPYIDFSVVNRWSWEIQADIESNEDTDIDKVMKNFAREVNLRIRRNLKRNPHLQKRYEELTGRKYDHDWWKTHQKHDA